jgi:hypothetical protein
MQRILREDNLSGFKVISEPLKERKGGGGRGGGGGGRSQGMQVVS